jgi:predicted nucleotidyltransferase
MKYVIDSKTLAFSGRGVAELFQTMNKVCAEQGTDYLVVGAFARDLLLHNIFGKKAGILTRDIDFGIVLPNWTAFQQITQRLTQEYGFVKGKFPHVFVTPDGLPTDLLPFGQVEDRRGISFPEADHFRINMMGFSEAWNTRLQVSLDNKVDFNIPTPAALILLKLMAWKDRTPNPVALKHVTDISLVFDVYFDAMADTLDADPDFADLYDLGGDPFKLNWYAAVAIGRKISSMVTDYPDTRETLLTILADIDDPDTGKFFRSRMAQVLRVEEPVVFGIIKRVRDEVRR